jgi:DNA polymerase I-like protein with 3'-5' exonuclease and polymerase domains
MKGGLPVFRDKLEMQLAQNNAEIAEANVPINVNSYRQVREWLDYPESNDEALAFLVVKGTEEQKEKAAKTRKVRSLKKQNTFITKYLEKSKADGYIYGYLNVGTVSGRSNCSGDDFRADNMQQIPGKLKGCFGSQDKYLVYADFSNLELRTFCAVVGEMTMDKLLRDDVDLHTYTATKLFNCSAEEVAKTQRSIAKIFNFSSLYGAGVDRRRKILLKLTGIYLSEKEAKVYAKNWLEAFPQVKGWQSNNAREWRNGKLGTTILGRRYKAKMFTDQNNIRISGTAAEIAKLAQHYMLKKLNHKNYLMFIHDSYTWEFDTYEEAREAADVIGHSMQEAWWEVLQYCKITDLPMPVNVVIGNPGVSWYDMQEEQGDVEVIKFKGDKNV